MAFEVKSFTIDNLSEKIQLQQSENGALTLSMWEADILGAVTSVNFLSDVPLRQLRDAINEIIESRENTVNGG